MVDITPRCHLSDERASALRAFTDAHEEALANPSDEAAIKRRAAMFSLPTLDDSKRAGQRLAGHQIEWKEDNNRRLRKAGVDWKRKG